MTIRKLIDSVDASWPQRTPHRQAVEGELLPALREDVRPPAPLIHISLGDQVDQDDGAVTQYETRKAQRAVSMEADVRVPFAQAGLTACAFGIMAGLLAWAAGWSWRVPVVAFALVLASAWLWRLRLADALLWQIETITQRDLDGDRQVGRPGPRSSAATLLVNPSEARATAGRIQRANADDAELVDLLAFVNRCANLGTSEAAQGIPPAPAARAAFARKRDVLIDLGVAAWRDPERRRLGWQLTMTPAQATPLLRRHVMGREGTN